MPGSGLGLSRCLGPGECLHSFIHSASVGSVGHGAEPPVGFPGAEPLIPGLEECVAGGRFNVNLVPYLSQVFFWRGAPVRYASAPYAGCVWAICPI